MSQSDLQPTGSVSEPRTPAEEAAQIRWICPTHGDRYLTPNAHGTEYCLECFRDMEREINDPRGDEIRELEAALERAKAELAAKDAEIAELKKQLNQSWIDEDGEVWFRPTAWAYAQACRVLNGKQPGIVERIRSEIDKVKAENATLKAELDSRRETW